MFAGYEPPVAGRAGHDGLRADGIGCNRTGHYEGVVAVVSGHDLHVLIGERKPDELLNHYRIVSQEKLLGHKSPRSGPLGPVCHQRTARSSYRLGLARD